jgi:predicted MPP superfamily phosphohydrolase
MGFVIFIAIAEAIVILGHVLLYFSWLYFFHITNPAILRALGICLGMLSISFIGASLLVLRRDNILTKSIYYIAAIWLGVLLYLFLATIATWILVLILRLIGAGGYIGIAAAGLIAAAFLFSFYGLWNAANPRLHYIEVTVPNLPPSWRGRTAVQISDVHLGTVRGRRFMERIVNMIASVNPDVVFITGDLFDGEGDDLALEAEPLKSLSPPLGIYFITGNHETYLGVNKVIRALSGLPITFLSDKMIDLDDVQLLGIDYPMFGQHKDLGRLLKNLDSSKPNIVLYHTPVQIDLFKRFGVNLQLAGHTHRGQIWPLNYITDRVYNGNDRGLHTDGNYTLYTSVGTGTWGPPMRTGNHPEIVVIKFK